MPVLEIETNKPVRRMSVSRPYSISIVRQDHTSELEQLKATAETLIDQCGRHCSYCRVMHRHIPAPIRTRTLHSRRKFNTLVSCSAMRYTVPQRVNFIPTDSYHNAQLQYATTNEVAEIPAEHNILSACIQTPTVSTSQYDNRSRSNKLKRQ